MIKKNIYHITLLTTTRGRLEPVKRLLESLTQQTYSNFTLLLGDQNPEGYLSPILSKYSHKINIHYISLSPQGLSSARNALLPYVEGDIVALTDDDSFYAPNSLEEVAKQFAAQQDMAVVVGNFNAHTPSGNPPNKLTRFSVFWNAPSITLFFRANVMQAIGNFDEGLGVGSNGPYQSGEETDYLLRILAANLGTIWRIPSVHIFHDEVNLHDIKILPKVYGYGMGRMYLLHKHKFPFWFKLLNVIYPLARVVMEGRASWPYRKAMFLGRLKGLFTLQVSADCPQKKS